jgi:hypothetical protein
MSVSRRVRGRQLRGKVHQEISKEGLFVRASVLPSAAHGAGRFHDRQGRGGARNDPDHPQLPPEEKASPVSACNERGNQEFASSSRDPDRLISLASARISTG